MSICICFCICVYMCMYVSICMYVCMYIYISRIQGYLLVKMALRFLSRIPKIYVYPRGILGVSPMHTYALYQDPDWQGDKPGSHCWFLARVAKTHCLGSINFSIDTFHLLTFPI